MSLFIYLYRQRQRFVRYIPLLLLLLSSSSGGLVTMSIFGSSSPWLMRSLKNIPFCLICAVVDGMWKTGNPMGDVVLRS